MYVAAEHTCIVAYSNILRSIMTPAEMVKLEMSHKTT